MPRDDFAHLERRWREQPLFLPRRRRLPLWPLVLGLVALGGALGTTLIDPRGWEDLSAGLSDAFDARAAQERTAGPAAAGRTVEGR
jgi:hypothetical protein